MDNYHDACEGCDMNGNCLLQDDDFVDGCEDVAAYVPTDMNKGDEYDQTAAY